MGNTHALIRQWAEDRNLIEGSTPDAQLLKTIEELGELAAAINKQNRAGIIDGIGDMTVTLVIYEAQIARLDNRVPVSEFYPIVVGLGISEPLKIQRASLMDLAYCVGRLTDAYPVFSPKAFEEAITQLSRVATVCGLYFDDCVKAAYEEIKDRKGVMRDGVFIKEADLNAPPRLVPVTWVEKKKEN